MVSSPGKDKVNAADRARALLTLAAEEDELQGPCLSAVEMAGLVEGWAYGDRDLKALREHLGCCQHCYTEWLLLHNMARSSVPRGRLFPLRRWAGWPYLGTALAAAACLAVYLNVVRMEDTVLPRAVPPVVFQQTEEHAVPVPQALVPPAADQAAGPPPAVPPRGEVDAAKDFMEQRQAVPLGASEKQEAERQKPTASQPPPAAPAQPEKKMSRQAVPPPAEMSAAPAGLPAEANLQSWLSELQSGCLAGRREPHFWSGLVDRGHSLLPNATADQGARVAAFITLLQGISGPDTVDEQCRLILTELAKEDGNR